MEYSDNELKLIKDLSVSNSMLLRANPPKIDEFYKNIGDGKTDERYDRAIITGFLQYEMGIDPLKYVHTLYTGMFDIKTKIFYNGEANKIKIPDSIKKIEMGAFDKRALAAHCVHVTDNDMDILKAKDVSVATNPISNLKLVSGICEADKMLKKGILEGKYNARNPLIHEDLQNAFR